MKKLLCPLCCAVLVAVLALAACGDSDTTPSTSPAAAFSEAAASPSVTPGEPGTPLPTPTVTGTIAFTTLVADGDLDVCAVNTDGTGLKTLAGGTGCQQYPRWSPDGRKIVYYEAAPGDQDPQQVWVMNADGSGKVELAFDAPEGHVTRNVLASWSPDGTAHRLHLQRSVAARRPLDHEGRRQRTAAADAAGHRRLLALVGEGRHDLVLPVHRRGRRHRHLNDDRERGRQRPQRAAGRSAPVPTGTGSTRASPRRTASTWCVTTSRPTGW